MSMRISTGDRCSASEAVTPGDLLWEISSSLDLPAESTIIFFKEDRTLVVEVVATFYKRSFFARRRVKKHFEKIREQAYLRDTATSYETITHPAQHRRYRKYHRYRISFSVFKFPVLQMKPGFRIVHTRPESWARLNAIQCIHDPIAETA